MSAISGPSSAFRSAVALRAIVRSCLSIFAASAAAFGSLSGPSTISPTMASTISSLQPRWSNIAASVASLGAEGDDEVLPVTVAREGQRDVLSGQPLADLHDQLVGGRPGLPVDRDDDVAVVQAGVGRRTAGHDSGPAARVADLRAVAFVARVEPDTDDRVRRVALTDNLPGDPLRLVDGDGEAEPDVATLAAVERHPARQGRDGRVDADDLTGVVDERPT